MSHDPLTFVPRKPRHKISDESALMVRLERESEPSRPLNAKLLDFSRQGFRIETDDALGDAERIVLVVQFSTVRSSFRLCGAVRWLRTEGSRSLAGFSFDEEAPLELLGELVLHGALETVIG